MALLISRRTQTAAIAATLIVLGASCALWRSLAGEKRFAFSHALHIGQEKLECTVCHESFAVSDDPGMPSPDTCSACHEQIDAKKPAERRVESLFDGETFKAVHASAIGSEPIFSHKRHVKAGLACDACHAAIQTNDAVDAEISVGMARCSACHVEKQVANECSTCHKAVDAQWKPASHDAQWMRLHGRCVRAQSARTADRCSICHTDATCVHCHRDTPPESHNAFFRLRGHGLQAQLDRASCAVCHTEDACSRCHASTPPLSHVGAFAGTLATHCLGCHFPLKSEGCFTCHQATPSHALAKPKPSWHTPAMNCRQCHGLSAPLPHVDKGDDCNVCHH